MYQTCFQESWFLNHKNCRVFLFSGSFLKLFSEEILHSYYKQPVEKKQLFSHFYNVFI